MKKLFAILTMILLFSISCKKDEVKLSDYVIGTWHSQELVLGDSPFGTFTVAINSNNTYILSFELSDGSASIACLATAYTVDNDKNQITINEPDFDPNDNQIPTGTNTFDVTWTKTSKIMTWVPINDGTDTPTLVWTKQ